jgi:hypothetical protein
MLIIRRTILFIRNFCWGLLIMITLILGSSCSQSPAVTYSIDEQYDLSHARSPNLQDQLQFSFQLERDQIPVGQDIFFVATFTNTLDQPLVFREPRQQGVIESVYPDTALFFTVEPITASVLLDYPLNKLVHRINYPKIEQGEFLTLAPHGSREVRLQLPHMLGDALGDPADLYPLPPGKYRVRMTYMNDAIGYEVKQNGKTRYVDLNAWVGEIEATNLALFTITSGE